MPPEKRKGGHRNTGTATKEITFAPATYTGRDASATDFAISLVARRHRLDLHVAAAVCELSGLGNFGRAA